MSIIERRLGFLCLTVALTLTGCTDDTVAGRTPPTPSTAAAVAAH